MGSYEHFKLRITLANEALHCVYVPFTALDTEEKHLLKASLTLACDMTSEQCDAYLTLFLLCAKNVDGEIKRGKLFKALLDGSWGEHVG